MKKEDISIRKIISYSALFLIPQIVLFIFSLWLGSKWSNYFEASPVVVAKILMVFFTFGVFFLLIPYIRSRENVKGIRYSIVAFFLLGVGFTLPGAITKQSDLLFHIPIYLASYILLTFIYAPEVLGIERNLTLWFKHHRQLFILLIYTIITVGYVVGFGYMYYDIFRDNPASFSLTFSKPPGVGTFVYYSIVSFTTIGYGDLSPVSTSARMVTGFSSMLGMIINVVFISILLIFVSGAEQKAIKKEEREIGKIEKEEAREIELLKSSNKSDLIKTVEAQEKSIHSVLEELRKL